MRRISTSNFDVQKHTIALTGKEIITLMRYMHTLHTDRNWEGPKSIALELIELFPEVGSEFKGLFEDANK